MAGKEKAVVLAVFDDIVAAENALDAYWDWMESEPGSGSEALGVLTKIGPSLDAQLVGDESGNGEDTGMALDVFEALLTESQPGDEYAVNSEELAKSLGIDHALVNQLRQELNRGRSLLLLAIDPEKAERSVGQLEELGGIVTTRTVTRAALIRASVALSEDDWEEEAGSYFADFAGLTGEEEVSEDYEEYEEYEDDYEDYDEWEED